MPPETGLSLGSNLGDRLANLRAARDRLAALPGTTLAAQSPVYETEPVDVHPHYRHLSFLNAVLIVRGPYPAWQWLDACKQIEREMGRHRTGDRNAPRLIDIDLLYSGTDILEDAALTLPHPKWAQRAFVVCPLADVRPAIVLPGSIKTASELLTTLPDRHTVQPYAAAW